MKIAEAAAKFIITITGGQFLRVGVQGGGCSGLSYVFAVEQAPAATDTVFEEHGARICIDSRSLKVLEGCVLDWQDTLMTKGLVIVNPNQKTVCSCGLSFSVDIR